jgi:teichuronic acid biosynthesis glycosyltransferase TuaC
MIALTQRRLPVVLTQHGIEAQTGWTAPLSRWTSRRVAHTIATSPVVSDALQAPRTTIIPCGVDTDLFCPGDRGAARLALGLPEATPLVLFVGDPRPEKRLSLIKDAFEGLQKQIPTAQLLLIHDEPRERMPLYMNASDVLVLASVAEGSPMVVREALACNLPVVSTDVGDVKELISGLAGCHIAQPEAADLADKLGLALESMRAVRDGVPTGGLPLKDESHGLRATQGGANSGSSGRTDGRARILPWSLDAVAERIESVYRQVLTDRATAQTC